MAAVPLRWREEEWWLCFAACFLRSCEARSSALLARSAARALRKLVVLVGGGAELFFESGQSGKRVRWSARAEWDWKPWGTGGASLETRVLEGWFPLMSLPREIWGNFWYFVASKIGYRHMFILNLRIKGEVESVLKNNGISSALGAWNMAWLFLPMIGFSQPEEDQNKCLRS